MSATIFAGSMEFVTVSPAVRRVHPAYAFSIGADGQRPAPVLRHLYAGKVQGRREKEMVLDFRHVRRILFHPLLH